MRKWGIVISLVYAVIVIFLLVPVAVLLCGVKLPDLLRSLGDLYRQWILWVPIGILLAGQAALLLVPVDTTEKRLKPRGPVVVSVIASSMLFLMLTVAAVLCVVVALYADDFDKKLPDTALGAIGGMALLWAAWAVVFYLYLRGKTEVTTRLMSWLLKGSILELLVAVPCHVIVRRRHDCSAPLATSFGIATGIAIMLLSFGPSVLLLYKKRMDEYRAAGPGKRAAAQ